LTLSILHIHIRISQSDRTISSTGAHRTTKSASSTRSESSDNGYTRKENESELGIEEEEVDRDNGGRGSVSRAGYFVRL
jgi:hypothetical protein